MLLALCPFIIASTSVSLSDQHLVHDLPTTRLWLSVVSGMSNAVYALGAVAAIALVRRFPPRRLFLIYEAVFVLGSLAVARAPDVEVFACGRIAEGGATGLLLVAALPPLVTAFGADRLPVTVVIIDLGLFGASMLGPVIGGLVAVHHAWRELFVVLAGLGLVGLGLAYLGVARGEPLAPDAPADRSGIPLAPGAPVLPLLATAVLTERGPASPEVLGLLVVGIGALIALLVSQFRRRHPLTPVRLLAHTVPVVGIAAAMVGGAVAIALVSASELALSRAGRLPSGAAVTYWPALAALVVAAGVFGALLRSRALIWLVGVGIAALAGGALVVVVDPSLSGPAMAALGATIGFGSGAAVSPALFLARSRAPRGRSGRRSRSSSCCARRPPTCSRRSSSTCMTRKVPPRRDSPRRRAPAARSRCGC